MKLVTFNILAGGIDKQGSRIEYIKDVIRGVSPDFLALQEANKFDDDNNKLLKEVSQSSGLYHYALSPGSVWRDGERYHVASLSRYPFKRIHKFSGPAFENAALLTLVDSSLGELAICNLQLHAYSEDKRLKELDIILNYVSKHKNQILLGDFNSVSSDDNYDVESREMEARFDVTDTLKQEHVDIASRLGLDDRSTYPAPLSTNPDFTMHIRIDYIFVSHSLAASITDATVIKTPISEQASDHSPFGATIS